VVREVARGPSAPHAVAVVVGSALYGGITVGGRFFANMGFSLLEIAIAGGLFGALLVLPVIVWRPDLRPARRDLMFFVGFGVMGTVLQISQFLGIVLGVPVAIVALLLYTQPVWTVLLGRLLLAEPITRQKIAALALASVGILLLVGPTDSQDPYSLLGLVAAAVAGLGISLWVILARMSALRGVHAVTTTFTYQASTTVGLLVVGAGLAVALPGNDMWTIEASTFALNWQPVLIYAVTANLIPALLVMWGMKALEASIAGVLLLLEPVAAAGLAWAMFGEAITGNIWLGGGFILAANAVLVLRRPQQQIAAD
jgi:DME family drug/metabolite transporter